MTEFTYNAKKVGLKIHGDFAIGFPGETKETIKDTIKWACEIRPHSAQFQLMIPFEGTPFFNELNQKCSNKLANAVKMMKIWRDNKTQLDLSSLALEKVAYDAFNEYKNEIHSLQDAVIIAFKELKEQIGKNIKHPSGGTNLNPNNNQKPNWKNVTSRDLKRIESGSLTSWEKVFGARFKL